MEILKGISVNFFLAFINHPAIPWLVGLGIIFLALFVWMRFLSGMWRIHRELGRVRKVLGETADPAEFAARFSEIDAELLANSWFSRQWRNFRQTLVVPEPGEKDPVYYTAAAPRQYFDEATLVAPYINLRLYQAVPNILVGLGIWFTFLGLVAALWFASQGVAASDISQAQHALRDLLHAATFKFVTSIAGLLASIFFSWGEKSRLYRLHADLDRLCAMIEDRLSRHTPAQFAALQYHESRRQSAYLARLSTDLPSVLAEAFAAKLETSLTPLADSIAELSTKLQGMNQRTIEHMLAEFTRKIQGSAGNELTQLAETLRDLVAGLQQVEQNFSRSGSDFDQRLRAAGDSLQHSVGELSETLVQRLQSTVQDLHGTAQHLHAASTPLLQTAEGLRATLGQVESLGSSLQHTNASLREGSQSAHSALTTASKQVGEVWTAYQARFENVDEDLARTFKELSHGVENYHRQVENFVTKLDQSLNQAVTALSNVVAELVNAIEDLQQSED